MEHKQEEILIEIMQHQVSCSREEARRILKEKQYNLVSAINELKSRFKHKERVVEEEMKVKGDQLISTVKDLIKKSNLIQLSIIKDGNTLFSIPITLTVILFYLYPLLTTITTIFFVKNEFTIRVLKLHHA